MPKSLRLQSFVPEWDTGTLDIFKSNSVYFLCIAEDLHILALPLGLSSQMFAQCRHGCSAQNPGSRDLKMNSNVRILK